MLIRSSFVVLHGRLNWVGFHQLFVVALVPSRLFQIFRPIGIEHGSSEDFVVFIQVHLVFIQVLFLKVGPKD